MKKLLLTFFAITWLCSFEIHSQNSYTLSGNLNSVLGMFESESVISAAYIKSGGEVICDKVPVSADGFFAVSGQVDKPVEAYLVVELIVPGGTGRSSALFVLEKGEITVNNFIEGVFRGTPLNDAVYNEVEFLEQSTETSEFKMEHVSSFIEQYKGTPAVAMLLYVLNSHRKFTMEETLAIINASDNCIFESPSVKAIVSNIKRQLNNAQRLKATGDGKMFVDFEVEYDGRIQRLSDYVGRGQYVLADFWASWCRPCRRDIPEVIGLYEEYKDRGLVVLGVAVDDKPENTFKAIRDLKIPYPQIVNGGKAVAEPYGINFIPHVILFGPDGTIIKRSADIKDIRQHIQEIFPRSM